MTGEVGGEGRGGLLLLPHLKVCLGVFSYVRVCACVFFFFFFFVYFQVKFRSGT